MTDETKTDVLPDDVERFTRGLVPIQTDRDLVFIDTETIRLTSDQRLFLVWELYAERHNTAGTIEVAHLFPVHDESLRELPERFEADYAARVPVAEKRTRVETTGDVLAQLLRQRGDNPPPVVVGANPMFDTAHLAPYLQAAGRTDGSFFRRLDIEAATYGAMGTIGHDAAGGLVGLTKVLGLPVTNAHTAHGDVAMTKNLFLRVFPGEVTNLDAHATVAPMGDLRFHDVTGNQS